VESAKLEASKQEIVSKIEGEEARLKLADAKQALREAEAKQTSDKALNDATIASKVEASAKAKFDVQRAELALAQMTLRAPSAGTIARLQHWAGSNMATYRPGDHAWPGAAIAELPDANTLPEAVGHGSVQFHRRPAVHRGHRANWRDREPGFFRWMASHPRFHVADCARSKRCPVQTRHHRRRERAG
jgi:hypothetical protein